MPRSADVIPGRLRRLAEELAEEGFAFEGVDQWWSVLLGELDYALHPHVHERRIPSFGAIIEPTTDMSTWGQPTGLEITSRPLVGRPLASSRRYADGMSSWLLRRDDGPDELVVLDRAAGSERDQVVMATAMGATFVQRHPNGSIRVVGAFGVLRWDGVSWHHEPPITAWIDELMVCAEHGDRDVVSKLLEFAVHDLGARGIGALLVYRPIDDPVPMMELRLPVPPPLEVLRPADLAPLRHVLGQIDGAAVLDGTGTLRQLGVRLVPSPEAEAGVDGYRGMRHTAARRYSFDDSRATIVVVSEDGPVTVLRNGELLGSSSSTPVALIVRSGDDD